MNYLEDTLLSKRAKEIFKFISGCSENPTFDVIFNSEIEGSRSTIRFALCELVDVGYIKVTRAKSKVGRGFQVEYQVVGEDLQAVSEDPSQENFWK